MSVPRVDGSKVRIFATRASAVAAAKSIGWPVGCVTRVDTRFQRAWALGTGVDVDPYTALAYLSRERFGELFRAAQEGSASARPGGAVPIGNVSRDVDSV